MKVKFEFKRKRGSVKNKQLELVNSRTGPWKNVQGKAQKLRRMERAKEDKKRGTESCHLTYM